MKLILSLLLASASLGALAQVPLPPPEPKRLPVPLEKAYGPQQAIQLDIETMVNSPALYLAVEGRTLKFDGGAKQYPDGLRIWNGRSADGCCSMKLVVRPDGTYDGVAYVGGRIFEFFSSISGSGPVLREVLGRPTPPSPSRSASSPVQ